MQAIAHTMQILASAIAGIFGLFGQHITYASRLIELPQPEVRVLFGGDMMFDRSVRQAMEKEGGDYIFSCGLMSKMLGSDLVVANLEGPVTSSMSVSVGSKVGSPNNFTFTFPDFVPDLLYRHNVRVVSLGNNHILNFGYSGLEQTKAYLKNAGVGYFGEPRSESIYVYEQDGVRLAFVGFNEFDGRWSASTTNAQVRAARESGALPVVFAHWGDEYSPAHDRQKSLARSFIDAGAEIVIGAHPHVVQEHELYRGKHIYYSLGNLIFDQYWNDEVRRGMLVEVSFTKDGAAAFDETYTRLDRDRRTCVLE